MITVDDWAEIRRLHLSDPPVLTMVAAFSGFVMALLLPTRTTGDLVAGVWVLLSGLGSVPKMLVWDNESSIGQHRHLTAGAVRSRARWGMPLAEAEAVATLTPRARR